MVFVILMEFIDVTPNVDYPIEYLSSVKTKKGRFLLLVKIGIVSFEIQLFHRFWSNKNQ